MKRISLFKMAVVSTLMAFMISGCALDDNLWGAPDDAAIDCTKYMPIVSGNKPADHVCNVVHDSCSCMGAPGDDVTISVDVKAYDVDHALNCMQKYYKPFIKAVHCEPTGIPIGGEPGIPGGPIPNPPKPPDSPASPDDGDSENSGDA